MKRDSSLGRLRHPGREKSRQMRASSTQPSECQKYGEERCGPVARRSAHRRREDVRGGDHKASASKDDAVDLVHSSSEEAEDSLEILVPSAVPVHIGTFGWRAIGSLARQLGVSKFDTWKNCKIRPTDKEVKEEGLKVAQELFKGNRGVDPAAKDIVILSALPFSDPQHIPNRRQHIGLSSELLIGTFGEDVAERVEVDVMHPIIAEVAAFLGKDKHAVTPKYVIFYCRSGRHRSVMCANILRNILEDFPNRGLHDSLYFDNWTHLCEFHWRTVRCQLKSAGPCELCSEDSYRRSPAARKIIARLAQFFCRQLEAQTPCHGIVAEQRR